LSEKLTRVEFTNLDKILYPSLNVTKGQIIKYYIARAILTDKLYSILKENNVALTLSTNPSLPEIEQITADFACIRWEGDRSKVNGTLGKLEIDRTHNIKGWANKIVRLLDKTTQIFVYFSANTTRDTRLLTRGLF
jgi:uncharacterized protein YecE (DUF72 family)